ncbi:MAG: tRNA (adenosine(37)-N6)-threonylcarbamoyltransferase complex transferase subunit TsaD, partial [Bacteroidota bacterium]|nr:tRNA (adenosine(37)-N6)-threonylcarbamoyltransferase complex transferase subunit TsaD [Bacteroidota bacterium]
ANLELTDIDVIAATAGPGLIGALLVGLIFAKGLAYSLNKPFVPVNHVEGHLFSGFLMDEKPEFPFLALVVSGGHTLLLLVKSFTRIIKLGTTIDDAAGEAYDKVAKMMGLAYPGGPKIQKLSQTGSASIPFPVAVLKEPYNFSFSGLKTSVLRYIQKTYPDGAVDEKGLADISASFQQAVIKALIGKAEKAVKNYKVNSICLAGGVAANKNLREAVTSLGNKYGKKVVIPDMEYCGDNAAMIAFRGSKLHSAGLKFSLDFNPYPGIPESYFEKI